MNTAKHARHVTATARSKQIHLETFSSRNWSHIFKWNNQYVSVSRSVKIHHVGNTIYIWIINYIFFCLIKISCCIKKESCHTNCSCPAARMLSNNYLLILCQFNSAFSERWSKHVNVSMQRTEFGMVKRCQFQDWFWVHAYTSASGVSLHAHQCLLS